jgi:hypothetical protein
MVLFDDSIGGTLLCKTKSTMSGALAYVKNGKLPDRFQNAWQFNTVKVPDKFHNQLARLYSS